MRQNEEHIETHGIDIIGDGVELKKILTAIIKKSKSKTC